MGVEPANTEEQGHATTDPAGEKENQEEAPDSTQPVADFASTGSTFSDGVGTIKGGLILQTIEADGAAVAVAVGVEQGASHTETVKPETGHGAIPSSASATGAGIAALGIYNGAKEFVEARKKGDVAGKVVSAANLTVGVTNLGINVAELTGKAMPEMLEGGARIGGAAVLVLGSTMKVLNAKPEDRVVAAAGEAVKDTVGLGAAAMGEGMVTGFGLTGASAAVAPVVLAAGAVYVADKGVEKVMDDRKSYQNWEKGIEAEKRPVMDTPAAAGKAPDPADYRHLMAALQESSGNIKYDQIQNTAVKRGLITLHLGADGRPEPSQQQIDGLNRLNREVDKSQISSGGFQHKSSHDAGFPLQVDLTKPGNLKEMGNAIDSEIEKQNKIMQENESSVPAYLRTSAGALHDFTVTGGRSAQQYMEAKEKLAWLQSGRAELTQYQDDLKTYNDSRAQSRQAPHSPSERDFLQKGSADDQASAGSPPPAVTQGQENSGTPQQKKDNDIVASGGIKAEDGKCQGDFEVAAKGQTQAPAPAPSGGLTADNARPVQQKNGPSV